MANSFDRLKELNLSRDEVHRIGEAFRKEEFRKLLADYVEEIQDPKNRQQYEDEITLLERERGQDVTFLHPTPGYVIKTSINGSQKCFINVCSNININKPSSTPSTKEGVRGLQWSLPHSLSPSHDDLDNKGIRCQVFDVLFHPDTLHLARKNAAFRIVLNSTAVDAVENSFDVTLDKKNLKFPKLSFKGIKRASITRTSSKTKPIEKSPEESEIYNKLFAEIDAQRNTTPTKSNSNKIKTRRNSKEDTSSYTAPNYIIKHRSHIDIQEFTEDRDAKLNAAIPKELIIEVDLPLLKGSGDMNLDVTEKTVQLLSEKPAKYKLHLTLPYHVSELMGVAKFDKDLKKLTITLPVKRKNVLEPLKYDSGVESAVDSDPNTPTSIESDDEILNESVLHSDNCDDLKKGSVEPRTTVSDDFFDASDFYNLPEYTCNVFDNIVAFTFHVKNVEEKSVVKKLYTENSHIKLKFTSVSSSFYNTYYSFIVTFPQHKFIEDQVTVETWDNNVILQIPLMASDVQVCSYLCGLNDEALSEHFIEEPTILNEILEQPQKPAQATPESVKSTKTAVSRREETKVNSFVSEGKKIKFHSKAIDILATSYESSGDELSASSFSPRKNKGILKRMSENRSKFGRSISESSLDDFVCSSYENYHGSIECVPEDAREDEENMSSSLKKTVRFSDVIMKQLFRSNSSILGQKKKNQRKARNKKRAQERRYSESEASDVESKKEREIQTNERADTEESDHKKKDDGDIFHFEMSY